MVSKKKRVRTKKKFIINKNKSNFLNDDYKIAYDFATKAYDKFKDVIKSVVLFGSAAKQDQVRGSDIDIIIIVDDCTIGWDQELIAWYREELGELIEKQKYIKQLHINTVTLSTFWEEVIAGEPLIINVIRYGQALVDHAGFFDPLKLLLAKGKIRPTVESTFNSLRKGPIHISRARLSVLGAIEHLYWAMVDSAHAALMASKVVPPSPENIGELLTETFVDKKILDKKFVNYFNDIYMLAHNILHGNVNVIKGKEVDDHIDKVQEFEKAMRELTIRLIKNEKMIKIKSKKI